MAQWLLTVLQLQEQWDLIKFMLPLASNNGGIGTPIYQIDKNGLPAIETGLKSVK